MPYKTRELILAISGQPAGLLRIDDSGRLSFAYNESYDGADVSYAMPVSMRNTVFGDRVVRPWVAGLLPDERDVRAAMAKGNGYGADSVFGLVSDYGLDLPGAVQIVASEDELNRPETLIALTREEVGAQLRHMARQHVWVTPAGSWSLGGAQSKLALRRDGTSAWYECRGNSATNVIVKPGIGGYEHQALNEHITMLLARYSGVAAATTSIESFDGVQAIVINRYDRAESQGRIERIHQEDMCQALSVMPEDKYLPTGPTPADVWQVLALDSSGASQARFLDALVFNYLTGSTDAHAKNYSLIHDAAGNGWLAPLYDLASYLPYMNQYVDHRGRRRALRTAMPIGRNYEVGCLSRNDVERMANTLGVDPDALSAQFIELATRVDNALSATVDACKDVNGTERVLDYLVPMVHKLCEHTADAVNKPRFDAKPLDLHVIYDDIATRRGNG